MRAFTAHTFAVLALAGSAAALAQTPPATPASGPVTRDAPQLDRNTQRVEHIRVEDAGSRVDEVRSGGETKSITVQPKTAGAAYDVQPADVKSPLPPPAEAGPGSTGPRTWKVLKF